MHDLSALPEAKKMRSGRTLAAVRRDYAGCTLQWYAIGERGQNSWHGWGYERNCRPIGPLFSSRTAAELFLTLP